VSNEKGWRAFDGHDYYYVQDFGAVASATDYRDAQAHARYHCGNYFASESAAMASVKYRVMNDTDADTNWRPNHD